MSRLVSTFPHLIAHRGWSTRYPENSFPAFAAAVDAGADDRAVPTERGRVRQVPGAT